MANPTHPVLQLTACVPVRLQHAPAPCLPILMPFSTRSWFLDCFMSQLVFFSPTGCLRTYSPAVYPPTSPKAAFFLQQRHTNQPRGAVIDPLLHLLKVCNEEQDVFPLPAGRSQSREGHTNAFLATLNSCAQDSFISICSEFFISSPFYFYSLKSCTNFRAGNFFGSPSISLLLRNRGKSLTLLHYCP